VEPATDQPFMFTMRICTASGMAGVEGSDWPGSGAPLGPLSQLPECSLDRPMLGNEGPGKGGVGRCIWFWVQDGDVLLRLDCWCIELLCTLLPRLLERSVALPPLFCSRFREE